MNDLIERQAVIDLANELIVPNEYKYGLYNQAINNYCAEIMQLPSVQPEQNSPTQMSGTSIEPKQPDSGSDLCRNPENTQVRTTDDLISREDALMSLTGEWTESRDEILSKAIRRIKRLPSVQPEQNDAEFWRKRSDEYEKMFFDLYWRMMNGVKFESMQFDENGITLEMKDPFREDNT